MTLFDCKSLMKSFYITWRDYFSKLLLRLYVWIRINAKYLIRACLAIRLANRLFFGELYWKAVLDEITIALFIK
jgi:hypothetical protein